MAEKTIIAPVDEAGRKLSIARRAVKLQADLANSPDGMLLTSDLCVQIIAHLEGWADNRTRIALIQDAANKMKVNS